MLGSIKMEQCLKLACEYVAQLNGAKEKGVMPCEESSVKLGDNMVSMVSEEIVADGFSDMCSPCLKLFGMLDTVISLLEWTREKLGMGSEAGTAIEKNLKALCKVRDAVIEAEKRYNEQLLRAEQVGNKDEIVNQCNNLGSVYVSRGEFDAAEEMYRKALDVEEQRNNEQGLAMEFGYLGCVYISMGNLDEAETMFKKALEIEERHGMEEAIAVELGNLSFVYEKRGEKAKGK
jgi:tetratricopeptide (TPR) repeat protein